MQKDIFDEIEEDIKFNKKLKRVKTKNNEKAENIYKKQMRELDTEIENIEINTFNRHRDEIRNPTLAQIHNHFLDSNLLDMENFEGIDQVQEKIRR
jgi:hypothetical protein